jgi:hypothetical protein
MALKYEEMFDWTHQSQGQTATNMSMDSRLLSYGSCIDKHIGSTLFTRSVGLNM